MPSKPLKPCRKTGCRNLTSGAYCPLHSGRRQKDYDKRKRDANGKRFYNSAAWAACRETAMMRDGYVCRVCFAEGRLTQATTCHHLKPLKECPDRALNLDNLVSVCETCHNKAHKKK